MGCGGQVLVLGKVSQAVVVAGAAYYDEPAFTKITGITRVKMVDDTGKTDVQVPSNALFKTLSLLAGPRLPFQLLHLPILLKPLCMASLHVIVSSMCSILE